MADDFVQVAPDSTGAKIRTRARTVGANTVEEQYVIIQDEKVVSYQGRAASLRIPGRAGTSQNLGTIFNASGSTVLVRVNRILVDMLSTTAGKAATVLTPIIRARRISAAPTGGLALTKGPRDSALTSNASVTLLGDAQSERTVATTALTATGGTIVAEANAPRMISVSATAVFYEPVDMVEFFVGEPDVILRASEGIVIAAEDSVTSTGNPATDFWTVVFDWDEYTLP